METKEGQGRCPFCGKKAPRAVKHLFEVTPEEYDGDLHATLLDSPWRDFVLGHGFLLCPHHWPGRLAQKSGVGSGGTSG